MKKFAILVALCLVFAIAAPALATDVSFSGTYRVRAILDYNRDVYEDRALGIDNNQNDWLDHRLRMQVNFKVSDNLKLITRFDGWDTANFGSNAEFINWDKIYMEIVSPIGFWRIGRSNAGNWGTDFAGDGGADEDNITYILPMGNWYLGAKYAKVAERDGSSLSSANTDYDKYVLSATYRTEGWEAGLLWGLYDEEGGGFNPLTALPVPPAISAGWGSSAYASIWSPYFKATLGDLYLEGEFIWATGEIDYDTNPRPDVDIESMAFYAKAAYTMGPATLWGAYAWAEGDADAFVDALTVGGIPEKTYNVMLPLTADGDFTPLLILWDSNNQMPLAGIVNLDYIGSNTGINAFFGVSNFIFGGTYQVNEKIGLGLTIGYAEADDTPAGIDDDYGWEYDVSLNWKIMDNLSFTSIFAYLDAGGLYEDFKPTATSKVQNPMMWYNSLTLSF